MNNFRSSPTVRTVSRLKSRRPLTCPKCRGLGTVVLMRRYNGLDLTAVCPSCDGRGRPSKNASSVTFSARSGSN